MGGDEFTVLLDDIDDASNAVRVAERLRDALQEPFVVDGHEVFVTASAGITLSSSGYSDPEEVLRDAAIALHRAKEENGSHCELFDIGMRDRAVSRLRVETDMRQAIERGAFEVYYQPIVSIRGGALAGFEALVRWHHPTQGLIDPADFIPIAEDTEMIVLIGRQVLTQACRQMVAWQKRFGTDAPGVMCVNVSSKQFADADLTERNPERAAKRPGCPLRASSSRSPRALSLATSIGPRAPCGACRRSAWRGVSTISVPATPR